MVIDITSVLFVVAALFTAAFAALAAFSVSGRASPLFASLSTIGLASVAAIQGSAFLAALFVACASSILIMSSAFHHEEDGSGGVSFGFIAVVGSIVAACVAMVLVAVVFRPPFVAAPMSGEAFESMRSIGMIVVSKYPVTLIACAMLVLVIAVAAAKKAR